MLRFWLQKFGYRAALGITGLSLFLLFWLSLGVGIIGKDGDPANKMYLVVIGTALIGSLISRLRPKGMAILLIILAGIQAAITGIALSLGLGQPYSGSFEILGLNGFFITAFATAGWLFHQAAIKQTVATRS